MEKVITNARIITGSEVFSGSLRLQDGQITDIDRVPARTADAIDFEGDFLLPGMVDVHTDHLEKHTMPRGGVHWNPVNAAIVYDAVLVAGGTTTVFDSLMPTGGGMRA